MLSFSTHCLTATLISPFGSIPCISNWATDIELWLAYLCLTFLPFVISACLLRKGRAPFFSNRRSKPGPGVCQFFSSFSFFDNNDLYDILKLFWTTACHYWFPLIALVLLLDIYGAR